MICAGAGISISFPRGYFAAGNGSGDGQSAGHGYGCGRMHGQGIADQRGSGYGDPNGHETGYGHGMGDGSGAKPMFLPYIDGTGYGCPSGMTE